MPPQRMMVAYDKLVGIKPLLPKEIRNIYMETETKTRTTGRRPPTVMIAVGNEKGPLYKWPA